MTKDRHPCIICALIWLFLEPDPEKRKCVKVVYLVVVGGAGDISVGVKKLVRRGATVSDRCTIHPVTIMPV